MRLSPGFGVVLGGLCLVVWPLACRVRLTEAPGQDVACVVNADCPGTLRCLVDLGRCAESGAVCTEKRGEQLVAAPAGDACRLEDGSEGICLSARCTASRCGDAFVDLRTGEACDDGNTNDNDACLSTCTVARCGDGALLLFGAEPSAYESCDDGNTSDHDACLSTCVIARCGDGHVLDDSADPTLLEECDDQNDQDGDDCLTSCIRNVCGDQIVNPLAEACDDGNDNPNDGCDGCARTRWAAAIVAGRGESGGDAQQQPLRAPRGVAVDLGGRVFVASGDARIFRFDPPTAALPGGAATVIAGTGDREHTGDGGPAYRAGLNDIWNVAVDSRGELFVTERDFDHPERGAVRRIDLEGRITTILGGGSAPLTDGAPGTSVALYGLTGICTDSLGRVYVADHSAGGTWGNGRVVRYSPETGTIEVLVGGGTTRPLFSDSLPGTDVQLPLPYGLAAHDDTLYVVDGSTDGGQPLHRGALLAVDLVTPGYPTHVAVGGTLHWPPAVGQLANQMIVRQARGVAVTEDGRLWLSLQYYSVSLPAATGQLLVRVNGGVVDFVAGDDFGLAGDGLAVTTWRFNSPEQLALDAGGHLLIADSGNNRVRAIDLEEELSTFAGAADSIVLASPALATALRQPYVYGASLVRATDLDGDLVTPVENGLVIARVLPDGTAVRLAGNGQVGDTGDGGPALDATFFEARAVLAGADGSVLIADPWAHRVRRVEANGSIGPVFGEVYDGSTCPSASCPSGTAALCRLCQPVDMAWTDDGALLVVDRGAHCVWRVAAEAGRPEPSSAAAVVAGQCGSDGNAGDGTAATAALLNSPSAVAVSPTGEVYLVDQLSTRLRRFELDGTIQTFANYPSGPGIVDLAFTADGSLVVAASDGQLRRFTAEGGVITAGRDETLSGPPQADATGDGGPLELASLGIPLGLHLTPAGVAFVHVDDDGETSVRRISADGTLVTSVLGGIDPRGDGPLGTSHVGEAVAIAAWGTDAWLVADAWAGRLRLVDEPAGWVSSLFGYPTGRGVPGTDIARLADRADALAGLAVDPAAGLVYLADAQSHRLLEIDLAAVPARVRLLAGGSEGHEDGAIAVAAFRKPAGLAYSVANGVLLVADAGNHVVRAIDLAADTVATVAGAPRTPGFHGDGGPATGALFDSPGGVAFGPAGSWYVADTGNHRVRRIDATGTITTVIGDGEPGAGGGGGEARLFQIDTPRQLALDGAGNLFVAGRRELKVVSAAAAGGAVGTDLLTTIYGQAPRTTFPESATRCLAGVTLPADRTAPANTTATDAVLFSDTCLGLLVRLHREHL